MKKRVLNKSPVIQQEGQLIFTFDKSYFICVKNPHRPRIILFCWFGFIGAAGKYSSRFSAQTSPGIMLSPNS
jgi:hypothetical protein